jgi:hypothetical protein
MYRSTLFVNTAPTRAKANRQMILDQLSATIDLRRTPGRNDGPRPCGLAEKPHRFSSKEAMRPAMTRLTYVEMSVIRAAAFRVFRNAPIWVAILVLIASALLEFAR